MFNKLLIVCLLQFSLISHLSADDTYWDSNLVRSYVHNSELQRRWAWTFLAPHMKQLNGNEYILDIGCGDGKISADLSKFVPNGAVIGIDPSTSMLQWARRQYCPLEYPNLSFKEGGFIESNLVEQFDVIISNCALQHCSDQSLAFKNLASILKPNGKLWISIPAIDNIAWKTARKNVQTSPKWASYWQSIVPRQFLPIEKYAQLLKDANLHATKIEKIQTLDPFVDREEFLTFIMGTFTPAVPSDRALEFNNELIDEYLRLDPQALKSNGVIEAKFGRIEIEAILNN